MKIILLILASSIFNLVHGQHDDRISTMEFVQILDNNKEETIYYYQNNWKVLREMAIEKNYIHSYQLLETPVEGEPFQIILMTTYANKEQYDRREDHFAELIKEKGDLRLLNDKQPAEFRKSLFSKEMVRHFK